jgi:CheY-like chemotaxis protein
VPYTRVVQPAETGLDGYEVARRIRAQEWGKAVTLVALTGWGQESDRRRSQEAGFDTHLVKPLDLDKLTALLAQLPAQRAAARHRLLAAHVAP